MRLRYPTNVRIIRVPCTGKVDIIYLLKCFEEGADGVFVAGCLEGDCHFIDGNLRAKKRVGYVKKILDEIGLGADRLEMYNLSSSEGPRFARIVSEMTERGRKLGPNPLRAKDKTKGKKIDKPEDKGPPLPEGTFGVVKKSA